MKILILGPEASVIKIKNNILNDQVEISQLLVEDTTDIKYIIGAIPKDIDGIFATGKGVYFQLQKYITDIPIYYTKRGVLSLSAAIIQFIKSGKNYRKPSFDVVNERIVKLLIDEYNLEIDNFSVQAIQADIDENDMIKKHIELYEKDKVDCIFTCFEYSYNYLKSMNIPVFRVQASNQEIKDEFNKLIDFIKLQSIKQKVLLVHNFKSNSISKSFDKILDDYCRTLNAIKINEDDSQIIFSNNTFSLDELLNLLQKLTASYEFSDFCLSISSGSSVQEAINKSSEALNYCNSESPIVYSDGLNIIRYNLDDNVEKIDIDFERISKLTRIKNEHLVKIVLFSKTKEESIISTTELSNLLNLTKRSSLRIIDKLVKNKLAKLILLTNGQTGRPEKNIKIEF